MITKQGLELMIIFQVWLGKKISKVAITETKSGQKEINKTNFILDIVTNCIEASLSRAIYSL